MKGLKKNIIILSGTVLAIASAIYGIVIHPQQIKVETLSNDINNLVRMVEAATAEQRQVMVLEKKLTVYQDSLNALQKRIYARSQVPQILQQLISTGIRDKVDISAMYPRYDDLLQSGFQKSESPLIQLPVEMSFSGQFRHAGRFIQSLDKQAFLFSISRVELVVSPESYPDIAAVVRGNLYLRRSGEGTLKAKM